MLNLEIQDLLELLEEEEVIEKIKEIVSKEPKKQAKHQKSITPSETKEKDRKSVV